MNLTKIIPYQQSGFRRGHGTASLLLNLIDEITRSLDKGFAVALVSLDYSRAFDLLDHELLCAKLRYYGVDGISQHFFRSYLSGRRQRVFLNETYSSSRTVISGVPQGSILGPLLFLIYTSDLPSEITGSSLQLYADDTKLVHIFDPTEVDEAAISVNQDLRSISDYSEQHNLKINPVKTTVQLLCSEKRRPFLEGNLRLYLGDDNLSLCGSAKSLGLVLDVKLRFLEYVKSLLQKSFLRMKLLYANKSIINYKMRKKLCETLILSLFNYCFIVYFPCLDSITRHRLQLVQNTCCRFVCSLRKYDHISAKICELGWLNLNHLFTFRYLIFLHRLLNSSTPEYLCSKLVPRHRVNHRDLRRRDLLTMPHHQTSMFQRGFTFNAVKVYNNHGLDLDIGLFAYRSSIRAILLDRQCS